MEKPANNGPGGADSRLDIERGARGCKGEGEADRTESGRGKGEKRKKKKREGERERERLVLRCRN
jgi:hypothetical protein